MLSTLVLYNDLSGLTRDEGTEGQGTELCLKKIVVEIGISVWYNAEKPMKMEKCNDQNLIRLPRQQNIELRNPLESQRLSGTGNPNLHHTYTTNKWSLDLTHEYR